MQVDESCIWKHKDERKVKVIENNESRKSDFEKLKISCEDEKSEKSSDEDEKCVDKGKIFENVYSYLFIPMKYKVIQTFKS